MQERWPNPFVSPKQSSEQVGEYPCPSSKMRACSEVRPRCGRHGASSCPQSLVACTGRGTLAGPLYRIFDSMYDEVRGQWEERFERRYGFWRGFVDEQVRRYLDCGLFENGFARRGVVGALDGAAAPGGNGREGVHAVHPRGSMGRQRCPGRSRQWLCKGLQPRPEQNAKVNRARLTAAGNFYRYHVSR